MVRKIGIITLAMLLVFSMASISLAGDVPAIKYGTKLPSETAAVASDETKIKISGEIRFRHRYEHDAKYQLEDSKLDEAGIATTGSETNDHRSWFDTRVRLQLEAQVSEFVKGVVELQTGTNNTENLVWGNNGNNGEATGLYKEGNFATGEFWIRQAWVGYDRYGYGLKVGHQLVKLGGGQYLDHSKFGDDAILIYAQPTKYALFGFLYSRFTENDQFRSDNTNFYVGLASYKGSNYSVSGDISYLDDQEPLNTAYENQHIWNIGVQGDVKLNPVTFRGDFEAQQGEVDLITPRADGDEDMDIDAYAGLLGIDWQVGPSKITVEGAIGTGDDDANDDDLETYITSLSTDPHYTYVYEYRLKTAAGVTNSGLSNTGYVKFGAETDLMPKILKGQLNLFWLRAVEEVALNNGSDVSHELGWEIDGKLTYNFAKNLNYFIEGGFMFVGDAYEYPVAGKDDAYYVANGIMLKF